MLSDRETGSYLQKDSGLQNAEFRTTDGTLQDGRSG
jgi:hypothetical protein